MSKSSEKQGKTEDRKPVYARNLEHLAWLLGIDRRTLYKWRDAGMPLRRTKHGYTLRPDILWIQGRQTAVSDQVREAIVDANLRHKVAQAQREERKNDLEAGKVIDAEKAAQERLGIIRWVVGIFDRAGSELASKLAGKRPAEVRRIVKAYFDGIRERATRNGK